MAYISNILPLNGPQPGLEDRLQRAGIYYRFHYDKFGKLTFIEFPDSINLIKYLVLCRKKTNLAHRSSHWAVNASNLIDDLPF